ncbi:hypothetical protein PhCBS80983_g05963 [Powellomyces hirtus]|uniref:Major facilitator superfamily (MFS) profile domain-containing protein n=1 Tax=Powellomyces hirtus TaxID=109895 RepID=A0A507DRF8_9FUNG|nr:hypothetical protein PhCBS80983_g05963 [Powellomyces hirtus]
MSLSSTTLDRDAIHNSNNMVTSSSHLEKSTVAPPKVPPFSYEEKRNILFYVLGIMCYKFGLESFNGTIKALALDRFDKNFASQTYTYAGYLDGFNQAAQCIGSIMIAPLVRRFPTRTVLAFAIVVFGIVSSVGMILEAATGGKSPQQSSTGKAIPGTWDSRLVIVIFTFSGLTHGMVELIRRIIPADIVGGNVLKLKRMDSIVHIVYEIGGTSGAFFATFMALRMGKAFAPIATPIAFAIAAALWSRITIPKTAANAGMSTMRDGNRNVVVAVGSAFAAFGASILEGGRIIFTHRRFSWLILGYSLPLVLHRYLENGLAANYAKLVLKESAYGSIMVGGSNFGELLGAVFVFLFTTVIKTPLPWLRLDAVTLSIAWVFYKRTPESLGTSPLGAAWILAAILVPISFGWAAGDVSLAAFIQSHVSRLKNTNPKVSALGAVMAFLYVTYIIAYAIVSPVIGNWLDGLPKDTRVDTYFRNIAGIAFSCAGVVIFATTFLPKGSRKFNPTLEEDYPEEHEEDEQDEIAKSKNQDIINQIAL